MAFLWIVRISREMRRVAAPTTFARAFFNLDSIFYFSSGESSGTCPNFRDCFVVRRRRN